MYSFEGFVRINTFLTGVYRFAYLNLLWVAVTVAGLGILGIGPASYALAAYVDGWFRRGDTPPVARTFWRLARARLRQSVPLGALLTAATAIVIANIFWQTAWVLQFANVLALFVIAVVWAYGFAVMAATDVDTLPRQVAAALMLGFGSLHWTILQFTAVAAVAWVLWTWALPLLVLFGVGIPASAAGLATRIIFRQLQEGSAGSAPDRPRTRDRDEALPHPRGITS